MKIEASPIIFNDKNAYFLAFITYDNAADPYMMKDFYNVMNNRHTDNRPVLGEFLGADGSCNSYTISLRHVSHVIDAMSMLTNKSAVLYVNVIQTIYGEHLIDVWKRNSDKKIVLIIKPRIMPNRKIITFDLDYTYSLAEEAI